MEQREITNDEQRALLYTSETPGFRLFCDLLQSEIDNTLGILESWELTEEQERRYLAYIRAFRRTLFLFKHTTLSLQLALRQSVDPNATEALFTPGVSESLDVDWPHPEEAPLLAPHVGVE